MFEEDERQAHDVKLHTYFAVSDVVLNLAQAHWFRYDLIVVWIILVIQIILANSKSLHCVLDIKWKWMPQNQNA